MRLTAIAFALAFAALAWNVERAGIASGYIDPVGKIAAQDEAVYSSTALGMARSGDWLTPEFLGRYALYKPPLVYWLSGLSARVFGQSNFSLRLPSLLAAAGTAAILFSLVLSRDLPAALCAVLLVVSNCLFHTLARRNLTDSLLSFEITVAAWALVSDPKLQRRGPFLAFSLATGAALLTKAVAGLLPLLLLGVLSLTASADSRPGWRRSAQLLAVVFIVAAPWHLYQLAVHPRWFWSEYVLGEHLAFGLGKPRQTSQEAQHWFYARRAWLLDPVLPAGLLAWAWDRLRRGARATDAIDRLAWCWLAVTAASVLLFQYRNAAYLLPGVPAAALLGARFRGRAGWLAAAVLCGVFVWKTASPDRPWGLQYGLEQLPPASALDAYARRHRDSPLILIDSDDEFYSTTLGLRRVRYAFTDPAPDRPLPPPDFRYLGITVTLEQFRDLERWRPAFRERLRAFDLHSEEPLATVVLVRSAAEARELIRSSPQADFYVPAALAGSPAHDPEPAGPGRYLLLSRPAPAP